MHQGCNLVMTGALLSLFLQKTGFIPKYLQKWYNTLCNVFLVVLTENKVLLATIINGLRTQYCRWVDQKSFTFKKSAFFIVQLVESRVILGFKIHQEGSRIWWSLPSIQYFPQTNQHQC